jgi:hypothetical protein
MAKAASKDGDINRICAAEIADTDSALNDDNCICVNAMVCAEPNALTTVGLTLAAGIADTCSGNKTAICALNRYSGRTAPTGIPRTALELNSNI